MSRFVFPPPASPSVSVAGSAERFAVHRIYCVGLNYSDHIREMIIDRRPTSEIKRVAREEGMTFLRDSALAKVREGLTTLKEINKVTFVE